MMYCSFPWCIYTTVALVTPFAVIVCRRFSSKSGSSLLSVVTTLFAFNNPHTTDGSPVPAPISNIVDCRTCWRRFVQLRLILRQY